jgi:hypothetical protein
LTQRKDPSDAEIGEHFSAQLERFAADTGDARITLGALTDFLGRRSIDALLLFLALPMALPVPAPGLSVLFGVPLILVSAQLLVEMRRAWLPAVLARRSIAPDGFRTLVRRILPALLVLEGLVRPRATWLLGDWAAIPVGAVCLVLAVVITLPVPLGHMVPGLAISILALGLLERDGLTVLSGLAVATVAGAVVTIGSAGLVHWLRLQFG